MPSGVQIARAFSRFQTNKRPAYDATAFTGELQQRDPAAAMAIETLQEAVNQLSRDLYSLKLEIFPELIVIGGDGAPIAWMGDHPPYRGGWFKELYVGGANPSLSKIVADVNGNVTIDGSVLIFGTVTAAAFNILAPFVAGLTLQSNTPGAGQITWSACTMYFGGVAYSITGGNTSSRYVYWDVGNSTFTAADSFTPGPTRYVVATNTGGTVDFVLNKLGAGVVQPENVNAKTPTIRGLSLTNNSPSGGSIAWSACTVVWNGIAYSITGSNTALAFVYWDAGNSSFTAAASFTPQTGRFLIATNSSGTGNEAWNTLPNKGIQEANLSFAINSPYQPFYIGSSNIDLTSPVATTVMSVSGQAGVLLSIGLNILTPPSPSGSPMVEFEVTIDGGTAQKVLVLGGSGFDGSVRLVSADSLGAGTVNGDFVSLYVGIPFSTSMLFRVIVTGTYTDGLATVGAMRGVKL